MLLLAAHEAWAQAGCPPGTEVPLILGTTAGGMPLGEDYYRSAVSASLCKRGQPTRALLYQSQSQARVAADSLGLSGPITIISNACASGANAIGHAWELSATAGPSGSWPADTMRRSSSPALTPPGAVAHRLPPLRRPSRRPRPGRRRRVLMLESRNRPARRAAPGGIDRLRTTLDPHHLTQPHPQGEPRLAP